MLLAFVLATLLLLGGSVVAVLNQNVAANRSRTRRLAAVLMAGAAVLLLAGMVWAVSHLL